MSNLTGDEATYSTRLQLEIQQKPSLETSAQLKKDLETVIEYRTTGKLTATEFFIQLKKIEYSMARANTKSKEAFLVFVDNELSLSHASKEIVAHVSKLLSRNGALSSSMMSEAGDCCAISWRAALLEAERDSKTGRLVSLVLVGCFITYLVVTKIGPVISEARYPFSQLNAAQRSFADLATESVIRVNAVFIQVSELVPMILATAGAALNLFRRGVRNFEINMMFKEQVRGAIAVHLAIGAWSGFLASYVLRYLVSGLKDTDVKNSLWIVGCFAAGYSSWFVDLAIDKVWRKLDFTQRPAAKSE